MSGFRVGDLVECVDDTPKSGWPCGVRAGALYTVSGVHGALGIEGLELREAKPIRAAIGFHSWRFRLIHRPRAEFITELLEQPINLPAEREPA